MRHRLERPRGPAPSARAARFSSFQRRRQRRLSTRQPLPARTDTAANLPRTADCQNMRSRRRMALSHDGTLLARVALWLEPPGCYRTWAACFIGTGWGWDCKRFRRGVRWPSDAGFSFRFFRAASSRRLRRRTLVVAFAVRGPRLRGALAESVAPGALSTPRSHVPPERGIRLKQVNQLLISGKIG